MKICTSKSLSNFWGAYQSERAFLSCGIKVMGRFAGTPSKSFAKRRGTCYNVRTKVFGKHFDKTTEVKLNETSDD